MKYVKKILEAALFLVGMVLFLAVIHAAEPKRLRDIFQALGGLGCLTLFIYLFMCSWDVWAWKMVFAKEWASRLKFKELFWIRLSGEAINNLTPFIDVGGEPLKVALLIRRLHIPKSTALSAVVIDRTILFIAEILFVIVGLALGLWVFPLPWEWKIALSVTVLVFTLLTGAFLSAQQKGLFTALARWSDRFLLGNPQFERVHIPVEKIDAEISHFYSHEKKRFAVSFFLHAVAWFTGGIEMTVMLRLVGVPVSLFEGTLLESLLQLVRIATFFIPGNLGAQEGGLALFVQLLGYHPALGIAASLLKRCRSILWTGIGLLIWGVYQIPHRRKA